MFILPRLLCLALVLFGSLPLHAAATSTSSGIAATETGPVKINAASWPIESGYVAFGDSYAAGMGTGNTTTDKCRIGSNNIGDIIKKTMPNQNINYQRLMCSGDTLDGLSNQINNWKDAMKADMATLSIGGNDLGFSTLVQHCILAGKWFPNGDSRKLCEEAKAAGKKYMRDTSKNGLQPKLAAAYIKILAKSGRPDFHLYVTSYVRFFEETNRDCDESTFYYWAPEYKPKSDKNQRFLTTDLRHEMNALLSELNGVISGAVDSANRQVADSRIHFVDVDTPYNSGGHNWCVGPEHEPDEDRAGTFFFLSGWKDIDHISDNAATLQSAQDTADRAAILKEGQVKLPDGSTCRNNLGANPDPVDSWNCFMAEMIAQDPNGDGAAKLKAANADLAKGNANTQDVEWWMPTRQIKTFHPRSDGMAIYRDQVLRAVQQQQQQGSAMASAKTTLATKTTAKGAATTPTPKPYVGGKCGLHVLQALSSRTKVSLVVTIKGGDGTTLKQEQKSLGWGDTFSVDSVLPNPLKVTPIEFPQKRKRMVGGPIINQPSVENGPVDFSYGSQSWKSTAGQCSVGGWDNQSLLHFLGIQYDSNRQIDCSFDC